MTERFCNISGTRLPPESLTPLEREMLEALKLVYANLVDPKLLTIGRMPAWVIAGIRDVITKAEKEESI